jgi:hypothetical protein
MTKELAHNIINNGTKTDVALVAINPFETQ